MVKQIIVKVTPRASRNELTHLPDGSYKARLTAAPVDGKANERLIELLSAEWNIPKSWIRIVRGRTSRNKIVTANL